MARKSQKVRVKKAKDNKGDKGCLPLERLATQNPFQALRGDIDQVFDKFIRDWGSLWVSAPFWDVGFSEVGAPLGMAQLNLNPCVDVCETDKSYEIIVELPGMKDKEIQVEVHDHILSISGEKKSEREEKKEDYCLSERRYGSFRRSFRLPENVNAEKIGADFTKGILTLTLPKKALPKAKQRKITIETERRKRC